MQNGIITIATVPAIGGRVMQYDLGTLPSVLVNSSLLGKTYTPAKNSNWYNFGGYKTWPAPQSAWNAGGWPPPPTLDYGGVHVDDTTQTNDSVSVVISSSTEQWYAPGVNFERKATMYPGTSRVKMDETIINQGGRAVNWSMWSITQSIVNHPNKTDYQNYWAYFPINPNSRYGQSRRVPSRQIQCMEGRSRARCSTAFSSLRTTRRSLRSGQRLDCLCRSVGYSRVCENLFRFSMARNIRTAARAFPSMSAETALQYIWRLK